MEPTGAGGVKKKRGMDHYLHRQWIATKIGREQHKQDCLRMKAIPIKAKKG